MHIGIIDNIVTLNISGITDNMVILDMTEFKSPTFIPKTNKEYNIRIVGIKNTKIDKYRAHFFCKDMPMIST